MLGAVRAAALWPAEHDQGIAHRTMNSLTIIHTLRLGALRTRTLASSTTCIAAGRAESAGGRAAYVSRRLRPMLAKQRMTVKLWR
ncbi:MAG: hypothetical protein K2X34_02595 [Hyphomonadaceae bacterium]|nr:hypothetical protein [Hyphomonadaceae bacterium]